MRRSRGWAPEAARLKSDTEEAADEEKPRLGQKV